MDSSPLSRPRTRRRSAALLMLGAVGAIVFVCVAAAILYTNSQQMLTTRGLEQQSQRVSSLLELSSQRVERMDYLTRLYLINHSNDDLVYLRGAGRQLDINLSELEGIITEPSQQRRANSAHDCTRALDRQVGDLLEANTDEGRASLTRRVLVCRDLLSRMLVEEATLLKVRMNAANRSSYRNLIAGVLFLLLSLAVVLVLIFMLLRDARAHLRTEGQLFEANSRLKTTVEMLEEKLEEDKTRAAMRGELQLAGSPADAYEIVVRYMQKIFPTAQIALLGINHNQQTFETIAASDPETGIAEGAPISSCCAIRATHSRLRKADVSEVDCTHFRDGPPPNYLCLLLAAQGEALGILYIGCPESDCHLEEQFEYLNGLAELSAIWIAVLRLRTRLEEETIRDGLTNLFNRRFMEIALEREIRLAARRQGDLAVLMLDLDHFKSFNDTFGHAAGDEALRRTAETLRASVRTEDIICRYGGEEFLIILPGLGEEIASTRAEVVREKIAAMKLDLRGQTLRSITLSIGLACFPKSGQTAEELVSAADRALYAAKAAGRNCVALAEAPIGSQDPHAAGPAAV